MIIKLASVLKFAVWRIRTVKPEGQLEIFHSYKGADGEIKLVANYKNMPDVGYVLHINPKPDTVGQGTKLYAKAVDRAKSLNLKVLLTHYAHHPMDKKIVLTQLQHGWKIYRGTTLILDLRKSRY